MTQSTHKVQPRSSQNPVFLEIVRHALQSVPDEIESDLTRTAYSPLVYEYKDYAMGMVDASGRLISLCRGGIPIFLANVLGEVVKDGLEIYGTSGLRPGDVILSNYPQSTGQHINHLVMYTPVFSRLERDKVLAFSVVLVHCVDIGGRYVGSSIANDTTEIFQEGIQLRTVKLESAGVPVEEIYRIIRYNTRFPDAVMGDIAAQLAACKKAAVLFSRILDKYGEVEVFDAITTIWDQSEAQARAAVRSFPNGTYRASSFLDNDGVDLNRRIEINVAVHVEDDNFTVDLSDVSPELKGPMNSGRNGGGMTAARIAFRYLTSAGDMTNEGSFRPLKVILPDGRFLSAGPRAPMARYSTPLPTVIDTIIRAVAAAVPERGCAGHHGNFGVHRFHGRHPATGTLFSHLDTAQGGWGASARGDGAGPFKTSAHSDTRDIPIEVVEALYPLRIEYLRFRQDSAGPGRYRGGLGVEKQCLVLAPCSVTVTFERFHCPPWGVAGGLDGRPGYGQITKASTSPSGEILKASEVPLAVGDRVTIRTGGGGGWGPPGERAIEAVEQDLREGYISRAGALRDYGVNPDAPRARAQVPLKKEPAALRAEPAATVESSR